MKVQVECRYFRRGYCNKGDSCPFLHLSSYESAPLAGVENIVANHVSKSKDNKPPNEEKGKILCTFYFRGKCNANPCLYSHSIPDVEYSKFRERNHFERSNEDNNNLKMVQRYKLNQFENKLDYRFPLG